MKTYKNTKYPLLFILFILSILSCTKHDELPPKTDRMDMDFVLPPAPALSDADREQIEEQRRQLQEAIDKR